MIIEIVKKEDFLDALVYYPNESEGNWIDLKNKTKSFLNSEKDIHHITIKDVATYLIAKEDESSDPVMTILKIYRDFDVEKFGEEPIETCPSIKDVPNKLFLRGGNKRSIAYAMKIIQEELDFKPIKSSHILYFSRLDNNNLAGLPTTKGEIKEEKTR